MPSKILVFGLPGTGKTTFARQLHLSLIGSRWQNADSLRSQYNDWDFSEAGRVRQLDRMIEFTQRTTISICDFVCPMEKYRKKFNADISVWMNTKTSSQYEDTDRLFEQPLIYTYQIDNYEEEAGIIQCIVQKIKSK